MLSGKAILKAIEDGDIVIDPLVPEHVGPNSVDLTIDELWSVEPLFGVLDPRKDNAGSLNALYWNAWNGKEYLQLEPGVLYLGKTREVAGARRNYVPCIEGRSSLARLGLHVHISAGFGDVGYVNHWTLELLATLPIRIYQGMRIAQIYFTRLEGEAAPYRGKYAHTNSGVHSRANEDYENGGNK